MLTTFEEEINKKGELFYTTKGTSMKPLLKQGRDAVLIKKSSTYKKYDVVLFKRITNGREMYVLHRILKKNKDGTFWIVGDNCTTGDIVTKEQILGKMVSISRKGKDVNINSFRYKAYVSLWGGIYPIRIFALKSRRYIIRKYYSLKYN